MITYSNIEENDLEEMIALYESYLNRGTYIRDSLKKEFCNDEYLGFKVCDDGRMIGFHTGQGGICFTYPHPALEEEIRNFVGDKKIYTLGGILLLEEYRGKGIAGQMMDLMKRALIDKGVELVLVEMWVHPDGTVAAEKLVAELGTAVYRKKVPLFYKELGKFDIECPLCGVDCVCGALVKIFEMR